MHLDYDNMHSETDFRPAIHYVIYWQDKRMSTNEQYEEPSKHIVSIGNHEKGMMNAFFRPSQWNKMCFCIKESYSKGKKGQNFHICLRSGCERWPPPPYGRKYPGFFYGFPYRFEIFCVIGEWNMCILTKCIIGWLPMFIRYQSINCLQLQNTENQFGG